MCIYIYIYVNMYIYKYIDVNKYFFQKKLKINK